MPVALQLICVLYLLFHFKFRCDIPVIVMGETGCGKTRLIKFMCDLWKPSGSDMKNMILMKVKLLICLVMFEIIYSLYDFSILNSLPICFLVSASEFTSDR